MCTYSEQCCVLGEYQASKFFVQVIGSLHSLENSLKHRPLGVRFFAALNCLRKNIQFLQKHLRTCCKSHFVRFSVKVNETLLRNILKTNKAFAFHQGITQIYFEKTMAICFCSW